MSGHHFTAFVNVLVHYKGQEIERLESGIVADFLLTVW